MGNPSSSEKIDAIRGCYLFKGADAAIIDRLAVSSYLETLPANRTIFEKGDEADGLRIIMEGLVRIWVNDDEGQELTITLAETGDALGDIALLDGQPRSANASTAEVTKILFLDRKAFDAVLTSSNEFARHLIHLLCERLRRNTDDLSGFAFDDLQVRLSRKIYELAFSHAIISGSEAKFERTFSQTELAQMLGATREAINKRLAAMSQLGLISIEKGRLTVHQLYQLADPTK